jgi:cytochrome c2
MLRNFMPSSRRALRLLAATLPALALSACGPRAAGTSEITGADLERGRQLIEQHQCGRCHAIPGVAAARGRLAVSLGAMGVRSYIAGRIPNRQDTMTQWIVDPPSLVPGTAMPKQGISAEDAHHMAAYLESLR